MKLSRWENKRKSSWSCGLASVCVCNRILESSYLRILSGPATDESRGDNRWGFKYEYGGEVRCFK
jgi:hypothetical protein